MTERDRLIRLLSDCGVLCNDCGDYGNSYCIEAIADYLLKNGVIVPPCEVGDTVYFETYNSKGDCNGVQPHKIAYLFNCAVTKDRVSTYLPYEEFGKTVFLTREEAEKALKK